MARTPEIGVRIKADGVAQVKAAFKAVRAEAQRSFGLLAKSANQMRASLDAVAKPVRITVQGAAEIAKVTAGVAALAAGLAGLEAGKDVEAGQAVTAMKAGIGVALDNTADLNAELAKTRAQMAALPQNSDMFGVLRARAEGLEAQLFKTRDSSKQVEDQWRKNVAVANELGVEIEKVGPGYTQLANATKGTGLAGQKTDTIFKGMLQTSRALGLSADETSRAMTATAQVAAKGKWSAEEAQQLAEAGIPANKILQSELGLTAQEFAALQQKGISAEVALTALAKGMHKQFGAKAAELANGPAASFARLKNSIFLARAEVANGGLSSGLATIADRIRAVVDRMQGDGSFARLGARIGAGLDRLPGVLAAIGREFQIAKAYAAEWWRQMQVAIGLDFGPLAGRIEGQFDRVRALLLQLAFDIPGVIYAMRQAFAGEGDQVAERYQWVVPLVAFIRDQVIPVIQQIPGIVATWWPAFQAAGTTIMSVLNGIRAAFFGLFGEEAGRKILAFLVIARVTGAFSAFAGVVGTVTTVVRALMATFALLTSPAGPIILLVGALALLATYAYTHCETFRKIVDATVGFVWMLIKGFLGWLWDGVKATFDALAEIWDGLTSILSSPFEAALKIIKGVLKLIGAAIEYSPLGLALKAGKWAIEHIMGDGGGSHDGAKGYRTGGILRGPGTGTSDSIPWWGSNGEGVINSRAVDHYGGSSFVDGINTLSLPIGAPADVVEVSSGGGRPFTFVMPGVGTASGPVSDEFADGMRRVFDRATAGRARQAKPRGAR